MQKYKAILSAVLLAGILSVCPIQPVFASISEADVQAQVDAAGKAAVSGNVFIWFLCAIAFLKVSQKIDSFMSSLGINVGRTGGSMLAEALVAARAVGGVKSFADLRPIHKTGRGAASGNAGSGMGSASAGWLLSGGLAGVASRTIANSAARSAASGTGAPSGIGGQLYASSVSRGGAFANEVTGRVATGSMAAMGSITGEKASQALSSYMGYTALGDGANDVPSFSNVEIGGGRITGTETSAENPEGISFGMYHTAQYAAPSGAYTTVHTADGASWYKQYAEDAVEKSPYMAPDGSIAYKESIVKKLPPMPKRKDRL